MRGLTGLVKQFSSLELAPEQEQRTSHQICHRERILTCQPMSSLHDGQYASREERTVLQPTSAPLPDGKMQLPLL